MRWETCRLESLSHWVHRQIDPQDSHSDWYRKWGKTMTRKTRTQSGAESGASSTGPRLTSVLDQFWGDRSPWMFGRLETQQVSRIELKRTQCHSYFKINVSLPSDAPRLRILTAWLTVLTLLGALFIGCVAEPTNSVDQAVAIAQTPTPTDMPSPEPTLEPSRHLRQSPHQSRHLLTCHRRSRHWNPHQSRPDLRQSPHQNRHLRLSPHRHLRLSPHQTDTCA